MTTATALAQIFIGATIYPTGQNLVPVLADFTSEATYTPIGNTNTLGDVGDVAEEIKVSTIDTARVYKLKGPRDAGDFSLDCNFSDADPGQMALMAANAGNGDHNFKIVMNNPGATGKSTTTYFRGSVMSAQTKFGASNSVVMLSVKIAINSAPLAVAAA